MKAFIEEEKILTTYWDNPKGKIKINIMSNICMRIQI